MPPDQLWGRAHGELVPAPLIALATIGWVIVGLFRSLFTRSKHFGLLELFLLMTGLAVLLGLVGLAKY